MHRTKFIRILRSFDEKQWRACHKYLKYCNKRAAKTLQIFEYVFKYRNNLDSQKLRRDHVLRKVVQNISEKALLNLLSHLTNDIESFLVHEELSKPTNDYVRNKILARKYKQMGMYQAFESKLSRLEKIIDGESPMDVFRDFKILEVNHMYFFSEVYQKHARPIEALYRADHARMRFTKNLERFYLVESINSETLFKMGRNNQIDHADHLLEDLLRNIEQLITHRSEDSYQSLETQIFNEGHRMSTEIAETTLIHLINYCLYKIKAGDTSRINNLSKLYSFGLEKGILLLAGKLSETRFFNIIEVVSLSDDLPTPEEFILKWIDNVETRDKSSVINIAYAHWYFSKRDYPQALSQANLVDTKFPNLNLSLRARWISICCLCQVSKEHEGRLEIIEAAKVYFRRNRAKLNEPTYLGSMNLVGLVDLIWKDENYKTILVYVEKCDFLIFRTWANEVLKKMTPH